MAARVDARGLNPYPGSAANSSPAASGRSMSRLSSLFRFAFRLPIGYNHRQILNMQTCRLRARQTVRGVCPVCLH